MVAIVIIILNTEADVHTNQKVLRFCMVAAALALALAGCGSSDEAADVGTTSDQLSAATAEQREDASADDHDDTEEGHDEDEDHDDDDSDEEGHEDHAGDEDHDGDDHSDGMGAHEHGAAELAVAWSDSDVLVDLVSPTYNLFGFEHEPSTDEEREVVEDRTAVLSTPDVIMINDEAGCELVGDVETELEYEGSHAEMIASWLYSCEQPDKIQQIDAAGLFAEFPNLEDLDAQWVSPSGQSAAELTPTSTILDVG